MIILLYPHFLHSQYKYFFSKMLREGEANGQITGASWLLLGSLLTIMFFPIHIAVPALIYLTIGDSFAALVGKLFLMEELELNQ